MKLQDASRVGQYLTRDKRSINRVLRSTNAYYLTLMQRHTHRARGRHTQTRRLTSQGQLRDHNFEDQAKVRNDMCTKRAT